LQSGVSAFWNEIWTRNISASLPCVKGIIVYFSFIRLSCAINKRKLKLVSLVTFLVVYCFFVTIDSWINTYWIGPVKSRVVQWPICFIRKASIKSILGGVLNPNNFFWQYFHYLWRIVSEILNKQCLIEVLSNIIAKNIWCFYCHVNLPWKVYSNYQDHKKIDRDKETHVLAGRGFSAYFGKRSLVILGNFIDKNAQFGNFCIDQMVHFGKILCALILLNQFILLYQYTEINTS